MADCYFFLTTGCTKGDACKFRHSQSAKASTESCPNFITTGTCDIVDCGKRHSSFHLPTANPTGHKEGPKEVCYFERVKGACTKDSCHFKHYLKSTVPPPVAIVANQQGEGKEAAWREAVSACNSKLASINTRLNTRFTQMDAIFQDFIE